MNPTHDKELINQIRENWEPLLQTISTEAKDKANGRASYVCPLCNHGKNGDGLTYNPKSKDGAALHCFSCGFSGDVIDLYRQKEGKTLPEALEDLAKILNIPTIKNEPVATKQGKKKAIGEYKIITEDKNPAEAHQTRDTGIYEKTLDFTEYYKQSAERLKDPAALAYLSKRGISEDTARRFDIGFDPEADPIGKGYKTPRIIIPVSKGFYVARAIKETDPKYKALNPIGGKANIFNEAVIFAQDAQEVFITEGIFDALSIIEAGAEAVALNSTSNRRKLLDDLARIASRATLILSLDNDEAGQKATEEIRKGLERLNISFTIANISGDAKDPNEAFTKNRAAFISAVKEAQRKANGKPDNVLYYIDNFMNGEIEAFKQEIKTGFSTLDEALGGLYSGLYCIAAISSLGKTTFAAQMADQIAASGHDVIFFSLEQSRLEIVSKSLARITAQRDKQLAVSSLAIRRGYKPDQVKEALTEYKKTVGDRLSIVEGNFNCDAFYIGDYLRRFVKNNYSRPVAVIDYLQILQAARPDGSSRSQSTKDAIDSTVTELKRISRELDITIFIISSVNRANYLTPIDFESLKESGGIEYTCDVIIGLQLACLNEDIFDKRDNIKERRDRIKEAKAETPRKIEAICLKNRYGATGFSQFFNYYPACDLYEADNDAAAVFDPPKRAGRKL